MKVQFIDEKNQEILIELPDGSLVFALAKAVKLTGVAAPLAAEINGTLKDMSTHLREGDRVRLISFTSDVGKEIFWHTTAHVLAQAVLRRFPHAKPTIGPAIENGFYFDFADLSISDADLAALEEEMQKICKENVRPERHEFKTKQEALAQFGGNRYWAELIEEMKFPITAYRQGEYFAPCRGPHLPESRPIKALKLLKTSGAYWRGDSKNTMLTRIYGISFPDKKLLDDYLHLQEEAKKRDHKVLGPQLGLFSLHEEAPGIPFLHPKGLIVWNRILDYWRECHRRAGYLEIKTPTLLTKELWERSGHWANYKDNMFITTKEEREFAIKPMNCPGAMLYYKEKNHSYRELPLRLAEIGLVHRAEASGALSGLFRVRGFHVDDAHIFVKLEDVQDEIQRLLKLIDEIYGTFGMVYDLVLSTKPDKQTIGNDESWEISTKALLSALEASGRPFTVEEGGGAFYGPKIDLKVHDALGRTWQCATIQLDKSIPERFDLEYTAQDGTKKRPLIIHRAIFGSVERFFGSLIEFFMGKFPLWLSPNAVQIIAIAERHGPYAQKVQEAIAAHDFIVDTDLSPESVAKKVRNAQLAQYNYILTIGDREIETNTVSLRTRDNVVHGDMALGPFLEAICKERDTKSLTSPFSS
jgi:threonyl-tRNA synthetase